MSENIRKLETSEKDFPRFGLESKSFKKAANEMIEVIINYHESLKNRKPFPDVKPGFMKLLIPERAPEEKEDWKNVYNDIEDVILKGMTHWQASGFFAYFPSAVSYPSLLGHMLIEATSTQAFTWASCPSSTELELAMMDWLARALNLPKCFLYDGKGPGAGCFQKSASDSTLMSLMAARSKIIREQMLLNKFKSKGEVLDKLVGYASKYSHSSVARAGDFGFVTIRLLKVDKNISLRGETLQKAIEEDKKSGKIPFYVCATMGTTYCTSNDNLEEIGLICKKEQIWLHVDGAYSGSALICPEFQHFAKGLQYSTSFCFNLHKNLMIASPCSAFWVRNISYMENAYNVNPIYLKHDQQGKVIDYRHWQTSLGKKFEAIRVWFVLRMIGLKGLRNYIYKGKKMEDYFLNSIKDYEDFEVVFPTTFGLVCLRYNPKQCDEKKLNEMNKRLYEKINEDGRIYLTQATVEEIYFLRVCTSGSNVTETKLDEICSLLTKFAEDIRNEFLT